LAINVKFLAACPVGYSFTNPKREGDRIAGQRNRRKMEEESTKNKK